MSGDIIIPVILKYNNKYIKEINIIRQSFEEKSSYIDENSKTIKNFEIQINEKNIEMIKLTESKNQYEKLFKEQENKALQKELNQLDNSAEQMKKQLDRTLEMLKKLQLNERIDDLEKELKENAENQELLKEKMDKELLSKEEALKEQKAIEERFKSIQEKLEDIRKENETLENPMDLGDTQQMEESIQKELSEAGENIKEGKSNKSKENQKKAAEQMEQLSDFLNNKQQESNKQQQEEDMDMIREILEKLMHLSFEEENLLKIRGLNRKVKIIVKPKLPKVEKVIEEKPPKEKGVVDLIKESTKGDKILFKNILFKKSLINLTRSRTSERVTDILILSGPFMRQRLSSFSSLISFNGSILQSLAKLI